MITFAELENKITNLLDHLGDIRDQAGLIEIPVELPEGTQEIALAAKAYWLHKRLREKHEQIEGLFSDWLKANLDPGFHAEDLCGLEIKATTVDQFQLSEWRDYTLGPKGDPEDKAAFAALEIYKAAEKRARADKASWSMVSPRVKVSEAK